MLSIDHDSAVPAYEQLRAQITDQAQSGELPARSQLPTVRRLAADLGLAPNTVARAYRELEQDGVVITGGRRGTTIAGPPPVTDEARSRAADFVAGARRLGLSPSEIVQLVRLELYG